MQLYPAIDMKGGKCVRLTQGLFDNVSNGVQGVQTRLKRKDRFESK